MLEELKVEVYEACELLLKYNLVELMEGSISAIDRESGYFVMKPDKVAYEDLQLKDLVVINLSGEKIEGIHEVPAEADAHRILYKIFGRVEGIVHTQPFWSTSWAQAGRAVPCYGTYHASNIYGEIPCTRPLREEEIKSNLSFNMGKMIVDNFIRSGRDYISTPAILCRSHGLFAWGISAENAVRNAYIAEECARMAALSEVLNPQIQPISKQLQKIYYDQKNGFAALYELIS